MSFSHTNPRYKSRNYPAVANALRMTSRSPTPPPPGDDDYLTSGESTLNTRPHPAPDTQRPSYNHRPSGTGRSSTRRHDGDVYRTSKHRSGHREQYEYYGSQPRPMYHHPEMWPRPPVPKPPTVHPWYRQPPCNYGYPPRIPWTSPWTQGRSSQYSPYNEEYLSPQPRDPSWRSPEDEDVTRNFEEQTLEEDETRSVIVIEDFPEVVQEEVTVVQDEMEIVQEGKEKDSQVRKRKSSVKVKHEPDTGGKPRHQGQEKVQNNLGLETQINVLGAGQQSDRTPVGDGSRKAAKHRRFNHRLLHWLLTIDPNIGTLRRKRSKHKRNTKKKKNKTLNGYGYTPLLPPRPSSCPPVLITVNDVHAEDWGTKAHPGGKVHGAGPGDSSIQPNTSSTGLGSCGLQTISSGVGQGEVYGNPDEEVVDEETGYVCIGCHGSFTDHPALVTHINSRCFCASAYEWMEEEFIKSSLTEKQQRSAKISACDMITRCKKLESGGGSPTQTHKPDPRPIQNNPYLGAFYRDCLNKDVSVRLERCDENIPDTQLQKPSVSSLVAKYKERYDLKEAVIMLHRCDSPEFKDNTLGTARRCSHALPSEDSPKVGSCHGNDVPVDSDESDLKSDESDESDLESGESDYDIEKRGMTEEERILFMQRKENRSAHKLETTKNDKDAKMIEGPHVRRWFKSYCMFCWRKFRHKHLKKHLLIEHPFTCREEGCGLAFAKETHLTRHIERTHSAADANIAADLAKSEELSQSEKSEQANDSPLISSTDRQDDWMSNIVGSDEYMSSIDDYVDEGVEETGFLQVLLDMQAAMDQTVPLYPSSDETSSLIGST